METPTFKSTDRATLERLGFQSSGNGQMLVEMPVDLLAPHVPHSGPASTLDPGFLPEAEREAREAEKRALLGD